MVCSPSAAGSPLLFSQNPLHAADHTGRAGGWVQGWECLVNRPPSARHLHRPLPRPVSRPVSAWAPWRSSPPQSPSRRPHHLYPSLCPCSQTRRWNRPWSTCEELNCWNEHRLKSSTASWHTRLTRPRCRHRDRWPRRWRWSKWSWSSWIQSVPSAWTYAAAAVISESPPQSSWKERDNRDRDRDAPVRWIRDTIQWCSVNFVYDLEIVCWGIIFSSPQEPACPRQQLYQTWGLLINLHLILN